MYKRILSGILTVLIVAIGCSCSGQSLGVNKKLNGSTDQTNKGNSYINNKETIEIQYFEGESDIEKAIAVFQYDNPEVMINAKTILKDNKSISAFSNELLLNLNTGGGPDIMIFENTLFKSLSKAASSGAFYDLNKLIKADSEMDESNFYEGVYNCGLINGSRYFVPLRTELRYFFTTGSILKENNLNIEYEKWTWKDLLKIEEDFYKDKSKYAKCLFSFAFDFKDIVNSFGKSFIDYKNGSSHFNNEELREALRVFKEINSYEVSRINQDIEYPDSDITMGLKNKSFALRLYGNLYIHTLHGYRSHFMHELNEEMLLIPYPSWYGDGRVDSSPKYLFGINSKCKNKEYAYKFLKYLLSEDTQSQKGYSSFVLNYWKGYPVRKTAFARDLATISSDGESVGDEAFSSRFQSAFKFMIENGKAYLDYDQHIQELISKAGQSYLEGKVSEEEALKRIDNEVELFLNE